MIRASRCFAVAFTIACCAANFPAPAIADGKISIYLSRMEPADADARRYSRTSWGGGVDAVLPWYAANNLVALTSGLEISNMLSQSTRVYDPIIRETLEQTTSQSYGRLFVGGRVGPHGPGFVRPHLGANLAVVWYGISTDIDLPDPNNTGNTISKTLDSNYKMAFGYDLNGGIDLNIANSIPVEVGMRYVKTLNVPQSLGQGAVSVSPAYIQTYFAIGMGFDFLGIRTHKGRQPRITPEH